MAHTFPPPPGIQCDADISPDGLFRHSLGRRWHREGPVAVWIILNPSDTDAFLDDQTIATITRLTRRWSLLHKVRPNAPEPPAAPPAWWAEFAALRVVNLSPFRCPKPRELVGNPLVIESMLSEKNVEAIRTHIGGAAMVIGGWGDGPSNMPFREKMRGPIMLAQSVALACNKSIWCVGVTGDRNPRHPLYSPNDRTPIEWPGL